MMRAGTTLVVPLLCLAAAGCQSPAPSTVTCRAAPASTIDLVYQAAANSPTAASVPGRNSVLLAPSVGDRVAIYEASLGKTEVGNARLSLSFANCASAALLIRVRTQFLDAQGARSEPMTVWREVMIGAKSVAQYDEPAVARTSVGYRVEIDRIDVPVRP